MIYMNHQGNPGTTWRLPGDYPSTFMDRLVEYFVDHLESKLLPAQVFEGCSGEDMDCFGPAPSLSSTIHEFSDKTDESLVSRVRDHVGGYSLGLTFCVLHLSLDFHRFGEDVNRALGLGRALNRFYWSRSFPPFGEHPDSLSVRQFLLRLHLLDLGSSPEFRTSSEGCTVVTTTINTRHFFTSTASVVVLSITSAAALFASSGWSSVT